MNRLVISVAAAIALAAACAPSQPAIETGTSTGQGGDGGEDDSTATSSSTSQASSTASTGGSVGIGGGGMGGAPPAPDCVMLNGMTINCDPQDQTPCNLANGEACDTIFNNGQHTGFQCYPAPNTLNKDETCPGQNGEFCRSGLHCFSGTTTCKEFCCGDADCTLGGTCTFLMSDGTTPIFGLTPTLGLCL